MSHWSYFVAVRNRRLYDNRGWLAVKTTRFHGTPCRTEQEKNFLDFWRHSLSKYWFETGHYNPRLLLHARSGCILHTVLNYWRRVASYPFVCSLLPRATVSEESSVFYKRFCKQPVMGFLLCSLIRLLTLVYSNNSDWYFSEAIRKCLLHLLTTWSQS
jgi:hypothetical protein